MDKKPSYEELARRLADMEETLAELGAASLLESERLHRAVVASLKEGVILQEAGGRIVTWNASAEKIFGITAADTVGRTSLDIAWPTISSDGRELEGKDHPSMITLATGRPCHDVLMGVRRAPDDIRWISVNTQPIFEEGKTTPSAVAISFSDCTARMSAEAELAREAVRRRILIEQSRDGIVVLDEDGKVFEVNKKFADMLGYTIQEALELYVWNWENLVPKATVLEMIKAVDAAGDHFETEHRRKDGTTYPVEISTNGAVIDGRKMVFCVCRDITERKAAEEVLRESEERFRRLFEEAPIAIQGYLPDGTINYWNSASIDTYGYTTEEAVGKNLLDLIIPPEMRDDVVRAIRQGADTGEMPPSEELSLMKKDGSRVLVLSSHVAIRRPGKETELYCIDNDLTEIKQLQAALEQAHKMEAIGTLTGGIAHDFNNILGVIIGNCELALDDVPEWNPAHSNLEEIKTAGLRAKDIVRQLLTFCRRGGLERKPIPLVAVLHGVVKFIRAAIPTTIDIQCDFRSTADTILSEPSLIYQVLMNLCSNAARAMADTGGCILIGVKNISRSPGQPGAVLAGLPSGHYIQLTVSDTGPGIGPDIIDRIFDPYFTTAEVGKGSGMGLAVVQGIINAHNGRISVESTPGAGAKFTVILPLVDGSPEPAHSDAAAIPTGGESILLVDDERSVAVMQQKLLLRLGYTVHIETDPMQAVSIFRENPARFDLVLTDMTMPAMDGLELARQVKTIRHGMPVILCTGHSEQVTPEKLVAIGIEGYLMKPISKSDMANQVRRVLGSSRDTHESMR
ncbi:MAG: PAS domain S-box protein [Pseudomonadota bacterium]